MSTLRLEFRHLGDWFVLGTFNSSDEPGIRVHVMGLAVHLRESAAWRICDVGDDAYAPPPRLLATFNPAFRRWEGANS